MKLPRFIEVAPVIALGFCLVAYVNLGMALTGLAFVLSLAIFKNSIFLKSEDLYIFGYFLIATFVYLYIGDLTNYLSIVFFPVFIYFTVSSIKTDNILVVKLLLACIFTYSILIFFRDLNGNFSFSLAQNIYMHQRQVDESLSVKANRFFKNATLISIWLVTSFVLSLSLYNYTKKRLYLVLMFASFILVFLSNTRISLGCCIFILLLNFKIYKQGNIFRFIVISIPILYLLVMSVGSLYEAQTDRFRQLLDKDSSYGLGKRTDYWDFTLNLIDKNVWGYGHDFVIRHLGFSSHNEYIGQAVSVGVIASIIYYIFIIYCIIKRYRNLNRYKNTWIWNEIAFYFLVVYFINGLTEQISLGNKFWIALLFMTIGWSKIRFKSDQMT